MLYKVRITPFLDHLNVFVLNFLAVAQFWFDLLHRTEHLTQCSGCFFLGFTALMHVVGDRCFARHVYDFVSSSVEHSCLLLLCVVRVLGADNRQDLDIMRVTHVRFLIACLMQKIFKSFVPVSLPELSH